MITLFHHPHPHPQPPIIIIFHKKNGGNKDSSTVPGFGSHGLDLQTALDKAEEAEGTVAELGE